MHRHITLCLSVLCATAIAQQPKQPKPKSYRLPSTSLKPAIIWDTVVERPDGTGLAFGGQDQTSDDGIGHTRVKVDGKWVDISDELRKANRAQAVHERLQHAVIKLRGTIARIRRLHFEGGALPTKEATDAVSRTIGESFASTLDDLSAAEADLKKLGEGADAARVGAATTRLTEAHVGLKLVSIASDRFTHPDTVKALWLIQVKLELAADALAAEPPPRALASMVFEPKSGHYVLFGGDRCDFLMADTWVFDPAAKRWTPRFPKTVPAPRARVELTADGSGKVVLRGGYTYTNSTDYTGGQYRDHADGDWTFDPATDTWTGSVDGVPSDTRVYRAGPFHPDFFITDPKPEAAAFADVLAKLPANTWVKTNPPLLPQLNRDWGTAVLDADRDLILRFSGGHSAHGGSDVLHYHMNTNRWELPIPVEFPLGQLYSNTEYPEGFNLNRRPWVTGHTYQNYGYDTASKLMVFTGRVKHQYFYDPDVGDWIGRADKPKAMVYGDCFYTLTLCPSPAGTVCWTQSGKVFRFEPKGRTWEELPLNGEKLPGSSVDNSTIVADTKRNRLLAVRKPYGKPPFDGQVFAIDLNSNTVTKLDPAGRAGVAEIPYLCQLRYDPEADLLLVAGTFPPDAAGVRRTPAFDCAGNRWVSLALTGDDPNGKGGRNVSLGMMYDAKRKLFWAVDTKSQVFVLRLDAGKADVKPLP